MILNCAVIDDEPLARDCIEGYISDVDFLQLSGSGNNPLDLKRMLSAGPIDLIFLDIQMPVMNGIDFLRITPTMPMVIIASAYPEYALEGFQLDVIDYLVKPITFSRFFKGVNKAKDYAGLQKEAQRSKTETEDFFFIKCDYRYEKIFYDEILYVEAVQNYVNIHTDNGKFMTLLSLKSIEEKLDNRQFLRVHKSFIIPVGKVKAIENNEIIIGTARVPLSRNFRNDVLLKIVNDKLWKK
ncbi:MAG: LytTR family DNA-binding domain-containing protein [Flavitalea sp.]